ncbi:MAG TPA: TlpA disulfide reductase family protein [Vicinamibacterales bacterium]|nr:TlpA disulfide reductase family protein [Vicinamibacterales bacterium]
MARQIGRLTAVLVIAGAVCAPRPLAAQAGTDPARAELRTLDGRTLTLDSLRGRVVLLDFWATWCAPCLAEMPRLKKLHAAYDRKDFVIIGISLDTLDRRAFRSWVRRNGIEWPQVRDGRGYNGDLARLFGVETLPVTVLLGRDGRVAHRDLRGERLETAIAGEITKSAAHKSQNP